MNLHLAETIQNKNTVLFPRELPVSTADSLRLAVSFDHMASAMKDSYRSNDNFIEADCIIADLDNDHSDDPDDWKTEDDIADVFNEVSFYWVPSRNNMKPKNGKEPRPRGHAYLPLSKPVTDIDEYQRLIKKMLYVFPYFDSGAAKVSQMTFGVEDPHVEDFPASRNIDDFLADVTVDKSQPAECIKSEVTVPDKIKAGHRNNTLFRLACSFQSQGLSDETIHKAIEQVNHDQCDPALPSAEITTIVTSACKYEKGKLKMFSDSAEWHAPALKMKTDKDGNITDKPIQSVWNAEEAIAYDSGLYGRIHYNEIACSPYVYGNTPWTDHNGWREWSDNDDLNLWAYIENKHGITNREKIMAGLSNVAHRYPINPIKEMLQNCYENWDGNKHVENLLPSMLGADNNDYTRAVMRLFMLGAVTRIYRPGAKFDYMMILVGAQGIGKSTFLRLLATNPDWYNDNFNTLENDKPFEKLLGKWISEMAELLATKRAKDVEAIKSFITSRVDVYRAPYARRSESHPRICVFAGTTNSDEFLTDATGNRRFLPVACGINPIALNMFRDKETARYEIQQAWGEIMNEFYQENTSPDLVLPDDAHRVAMLMQEKYREADPYESAVRSYIDDNIDVSRVCAVMLWHEALKHPDWQQPQRSDSRRLNDIMKSLDGWNEMDGQQRCGKYGQQKRCFERKQQFIEVEDNEVPFD